MNLKPALLAASIPLFMLFSSCENTPSGTTLEGTIDGTLEIRLARIGTDKIDYVDTLQLKDGRFSFSPQVDKAELWMLEVPDGLRLSLFIQPNEHIQLTANADDPGYEYSISGSEGSERILRINKVMANMMAGLDSLNEVNNASIELPNYAQIRNGLDSAYFLELERTRNTLLAMLEEDPGHLTNLFIFPLGIGNQQLLPAEIYFDRYESSLAAMQERYPEDPHVNRFSQRIQQMKDQMEAQMAFMEAEANSSEGKVAPDITLPDTQGLNRSLSDLKGKVVLVDFWAAWCRPCRAENPNVVRMYERFKNQGFEIFSVSLDGLPNQPNAKEAWLNAIKDDGLIWPNHVSDLQGWDAQAVTTYGFQSIPFTLLLDRNGVVLARGLRGPALEQAIENAL